MSAEEGGLNATLRYVMEFVADMDRAIRCYRGTLGLTPKFESPYWTEIATGETTLALHPASADHPAGTFRLGFRVPDIQAFYTEMSAKGITFTAPPVQQFGTTLAQVLDPDGAACVVGSD